LDACLLDVAYLIDVPCLVMGACLVTEKILKNSPVGACLLDVAYLMDVDCLVIGAYNTYDIKYNISLLCGICGFCGFLTRKQYLHMCSANLCHRPQKP